MANGVMVLFASNQQTGSRIDRPLSDHNVVVLLMVLKPLQ